MGHIHPSNTPNLTYPFLHTTSITPLLSSPSLSISFQCHHHISLLYKSHRVFLSISKSSVVSPVSHSCLYYHPFFTTTTIRTSTSSTLPSTTSLGYSLCNHSSQSLYMSISSLTAHFSSLAAGLTSITCHPFFSPGTLLLAFQYSPLPSPHSPNLASSFSQNPKI